MYQASCGDAEGLAHTHRGLREVPLHLLHRTGLKALPARPSAILRSGTRPTNSAERFPPPYEASTSAMASGM